LILKKFENIASTAIKDGTSDIYITGGHLMVLRKNGAIQFCPPPKWLHQDVDELVKRMLSSKQLAVLREKKSFDQAVSAGNARLRINYFITRRGLSMAIRILPGRVPTIEGLNLHPSLHEIGRGHAGLVLICGATSMGKTSTIAAIINDINTSRKLHVITLEDPVEYRFRSNKSFVQQRELGSDMPSFQQGLIDILRENPDVIVISELREPETMRLALNAAESGHLVIATLHASTPEEAIYRLCNSAPSEFQDAIRFQIASTLNWLIIQQLIYVETKGYRLPSLTIARGVVSVKNVIRENKLHQLSSIIQVGKNEGMFSADRYLTEYIQPCQTFVSPAVTFQPSAEESQETIYQSPLMEEVPAALSMYKQPALYETKSVLSTIHINGEAEHVLKIDEDESMQEIINRLNNPPRS